MGFYLVELQKVVYVQPCDLGPAVRRSLEANLRAAVERKRLDDVGLMVAVKDIINPGDGKVLDNGLVSFNLTYQGVAFNLFKGEVIDAIVSEVRQDALLADCGACVIHISRYHVPEGFSYETDGVSPRFITRSGDASIQKGDLVRLRAISDYTGKAGSTVLGTLKGEWLGPRV